MRKNRKPAGGAQKQEIIFDEKVPRRAARILEAKLAEFGIPDKVVEVCPGPSVTTFDICKMSPASVSVEDRRTASLPTSAATVDPEHAYKLRN